MNADSAFPSFPTLLPRPLDERAILLLERARVHAADFATRAERHDRDSSFPHENYDAMRASGYAHMTLPSRLGGEDVDLLELSTGESYEVPLLHFFHERARRVMRAGG